MKAQIVNSSYIFVYLKDKGTYPAKADRVTRKRVYYTDDEDNRKRWAPKDKVVLQSEWESRQS